MSTLIHLALCAILSFLAWRALDEAKGHAFVRRNAATAVSLVEVFLLFALAILLGATA